MATGGVGLFGGSFNPIHHGHLIAARAVAEGIGLSRVIFIPAPNPPHKPGVALAGAEDRLAMVRLAVAGEPGFEASDVEIRRSGPSYTIVTVESFIREMPGEALCWVIGADTLGELHTWQRVGDLVELCRIVTAARPGFESPDLEALGCVLRADQVERLKRDILATPGIDVSASGIRRRVATGWSIRYLVPEAVRSYIEERGLYREGGPGVAGRRGCGAG